MTKSTITDERITSVIDRLEHFASNLKWTDVRGAQDLLTAADGLRELQERRKADSEPVGYFGRFDPDDEDLIDQCSKNVKGAFPLYRHAQPAPVVPEEMPCGGAADDYHDGYQDGWNACRAAMLQAEPVTTANKLGNSPVIPDGYAMVPKEATLDMLKAGAKQEMKGEAFQYVWQAMLAAAPQEAQVVPEKIEQSRKRVDRCDVCTEGARGGCGTCIFNGNFE
ncbi:hypothetical protein RFD10_002439 [Klebsiella aerogenes]|uniref:hypothetical protein n=1 Tax=Klebsiella aerogenes TaxID=548 RepID=UPI001EEB4ABE|nr:hypothetical protein [Klebsiella aerogenes]